MDERAESLDLDPFWPPASGLMGLRFASEEDFERCEAVLAENIERFRMVNKWDRFVVVRKTDLHLFREARLNCTGVELS